MSSKTRELWARAILLAMADEVPTWPKRITTAQVEAQFFYRLWMRDLGFQLWVF